MARGFDEPLPNSNNALHLGQPEFTTQIGTALIGNLEGQAVFAKLFPLFPPRIVNGTFRVIGSGFGADELNHIDAAEITELVALRLQPDVPDTRDFRGHVL